MENGIVSDAEVIVSIVLTSLTMVSVGLGGVPGVLLLLPFFGEKLESSFAFGFIGYYFLCQQAKTFHVRAWRNWSMTLSMQM